MSFSFYVCFHRTGIAYELNDYSADGTLTDWIAGEAKVPYAFTVEMWGGPMHDSCFVQFNPDNDHLRHDLDQIFPIYPVALEAFAAKATHEHFSSYRLHSPEHARQAERTCRLHRGSMASGRGDQGDGMVVDGKTDSPPVYNIIVERRAHP